MNLVYVRFLCDNERFKVPVSHFESQENTIAKGVVTWVFFSENEEDTPETIAKDQGKIIKFKTSSVSKTSKPGYYEAEVLLIAATEPELDELIDARRITQKTPKFIEMQRKNTIKKKSKVTAAATKRLYKKSENKVLHDLKNKYEASDSSSTSSSTASDSERDIEARASLSSAKNKKDKDTVKVSNLKKKEKELTEASAALDRKEEEINELKSTVKKREKEISELKRGLNSKQEKINTSEKERKKLGTELRDLQILNLSLQKQLLAYLAKEDAGKETTSESPSKATRKSTTTSSSAKSPGSKSSKRRNVESPKKILKKLRGSPSKKGAEASDDHKAINVKKELFKSKSEDSDEDVCGPESNNSDVQELENSGTPSKIKSDIQEAKDVEDQEPKDPRDDSDFELDEEGIQGCYYGVKPGKAGDSQFAKNLAGALFSDRVLLMSSVTGRKCPANAKDPTKKAKPPLSETKMKLLRGLYKGRIDEEVIELKKRSSHL